MTAASALSYPFPLATALETSALVATARGVSPDVVAPWVATAADIRRAGDRPVPAPLAQQVATLTAALPAAGPLSAAEAASRAVG